ncbi:MAG TPA: hypothetical protein ENI87_01500 [bacterium]|nr:hypothetical protein [bacterium]
MTNNLSEEMQRTARQALAGLSPSGHADDAGGLPVGKLLSAFFRARYLVFGTTLFGVLVGMFLAITTPNSYVSTGKFLFTSTGAESTLLAPTQAAETSQETIETGASYILDSDDLLMKVVDRLGPERILQPYQPRGGVGAVKDLFHSVQRDWNAIDPSKMTPEEALKRLQKTVHVERPRFTPVLIATCQANDPELAQEILSTFMDAAIEWHIEKYDDQKAYDEAERAHNETVAAHEAAQNAMRTFLERKAMVTQFDQQLKAVETYELEAAARLKAIQDELKVKQKELESYNALLNDPERMPRTRMRKVPRSASSEVLRELNSQLAAALLKQVEVQRVYSDPNAMERRSADQRVRDLEAAIEKQRTADGGTEFVEEVSENPQYVSLLEARNALEFELVGLGVRLEQAKELHEEQAKELQRLLALEPEYERLRAEVVRTENEKETAASLWEMAQKKRALGLGKYSTLKSFQEASLPLEKEGPNRGKLLLGGFFVGLFLGLGLVVVRTLPDRVVRTRNDLEGLDDLAVIGVMPRLDRVNLRRHMALREQGW